MYRLALERLGEIAQNRLVAGVVLNALLFRFSEVGQFEQLLTPGMGIGLDYELLFSLKEPASIAQIIDDDSCFARLPQEAIPAGSVVAICTAPEVGIDPVTYSWEVCTWDEYMRAVMQVLSITLDLDVLSHPGDRDALREVLVSLRA